MHSRGGPSFSRHGAFSLIELLSVIAIIGIMLTATIPIMGKMTASSQRTKFLSDISNLLEMARQEAISRNTYVWVAFGTEEETLYAAAIASRTGLSQGYGPEEVWATATIDLTSSQDFIPISRVLQLGNYQLSSQASNFGNQPGFTTRQGGNGELALSRSIQFSPSGEARVAPGLQGNLVFEAKATQGQFSNLEETIIVNGPTGFTSIVNRD